MALEGFSRRSFPPTPARSRRHRLAGAAVLALCALIGLTAAGATSAGAQVPGTDLVTSFTPSALRNDFNGWVGMRIQGGASDISVSGLGRFVVSGNTQSHDVRLVLASTGADVATATVATSGQPADAFAFTALGSPVTLLANTTYYLLSREFAGGDTWYDYNTSTVTTSAAANTGVVWATAGAPASFNAGGATGQSYGVPNLRYTTMNAAPSITQHPADATVTAGNTAVFTAAASGVPTPTVQWEAMPPAGAFAPIGGATSTVLTVPSVTVGQNGTQYRAVFTNTSGPSATTDPATLTVNASPPAAGEAFVTHFTPSALRNDFTGWVGMRIQGGASDISVKSLGRWVVAGNSQDHDLRLVQAATGAQIATATVATSGHPAGTFAFTDLGAPVTLLANTTYYLLSEETAGGDTWYDYNTSTTTTAAASNTGVAWATAGAPNAFVAGGGLSQSFGVPNLRYTTMNAAPAVTEHPASLTVTAGATAVFSAAASGVPTPTVQWEAMPPAGSFAPIGGATSTVLTVPNVTLGQHGTEYRAVFSNTSGPSATTNAATLSVAASPPLEGTPLVTFFTPSALRNDFNGWVGMRLQVGASNLSVSSLGRWVVAGNTQAHPVRLVTTAGAEVASATVATSGQPAGAFAYTALGAPVTLTANTTYYLLTEEFAGGDTWYDYNTAVVTTSAASDTGVVWATAGSPNTFNAGGAAGQSYVVPNLRYTVLNAAPTDIALTATSVAENQPSGTDVGTFSTTDPDAGDTFTYSLVSGSGSADNGSFTIAAGVLKTAASFDFETKSSYLIRVRTTDAGGLFFEKEFTISVTNANDAPTDILLIGTSVDENAAVNTVVGALGTIDPDAGQAHTYTLVAGDGSADNASFNISGTSLRTSASFNFEVKNSYSVRIRSTDNGTPNLFIEEQFTITVIDVNDAPVTVADSYSGAIGNTLFVLNSGGTGPKVTVAGSVITANDTDEDGDTLSAVPETVASLGGGTATIAADGTFTFLPGVGDKNQTDSFTYKVTDGSLTTNGTVSVAIGADRAWYVDNSLGVNGDGRSSSPFNVLSAVSNGADPDDTGDYLFLYQGSGNYTGGLVLEANQRLSGQPEGFVVNGTTLLAGSGSRPSITNGAGAGIALANNTVVRNVIVTGTSGAGITGSSVATADIGASVSITNSTGAAFSLLNAANGNVTMAGTITHSSGGDRSVLVTARTGGTVAFSGAVNDTAGGIQVTNSGGATVNFTGGLTVSSGGNKALTATGGGVVNVTGTNTLASTTGSALEMSGGTTIGASGLTFQSINSNGGANPGILLNGTGSAGGLSVTGTGAAGSGGTIQNKSGAGISLTSVGGVVSLTNMATTAVAGTDVLVNGGAANVTYTGTISSSGGRSIDVSNKTGGTVLFSGSVNDTGTGISLVNNGGATVNLTGGVTLSTTTNEAFAATGGGTVSVTGSANTITTTTGRALNVANTNIGASGLTFRSITAGTVASGPANGIILNATGSSGGLTVTGTGSAGTGGTIQRTTGHALDLTSTRSVNLSYMNVQNNLGNGIDGSSVTNLNLTNCNFTSNGDAAGEDGIYILNLLGTSAWSNVSVNGSARNNVFIDNATGTLDSWTVTGTSHFDNLGTAFGGNSVLVQARGSAVITSGSISGATFQNNKPARGVTVQAQGSSTIGSFTVENGTFTNNGLQASFEQSGTANLTFRFQNNGSPGSPMTMPNTAVGTSHAVNVFSSSTSTAGTIKGRVTGNHIGDASVAGSGSAIGNGIRTVIQGKTVATLLFDGNVIRQTPQARGMDIQVLGPLDASGSGTHDITVTNNNVVPSDTTGFPASAIYVAADSQGGGTVTVRTDVRGNTVPAGTAVDSLPTYLALDDVAVPAVCQLVDTAPASANATVQLTSTNTGSASAAGSCTLIAGPITTPP